MLKQFFAKHREIIVYLTTGLMSTLFSWFVFWVGTLFLDIEESWLQNALCNTMAWVASLCFGYPANRIFVFRSQNPEIVKEFLEFASCRLSVWALDVCVMGITVNQLHWNKWISKICISTTLVTITNYIICKYIIFKKQEEPQEAI